MIPGQEQSNEQTKAHKLVDVSLGHHHLQLRPGQSRNGAALRWASKQGLLEQVHAILRAGGNDEALRDADENGLTAAHLAASHGKMDILRALITAGADISLRQKDGFTPLHWAAIRGHRDITELLLENGSDPSWADNDGHTASWLAAFTNHSDILKVLAAAGDDLSRVNNEGSSLLHAAASNGAREVFEMLINTRANTLRWRSNTAWTPLDVALALSSVEMTKRVLVLAADKQFQDTSFDIDNLSFSNYGATALMNAAFYGREEVAELLIDYGANIHVTNLREATALHIAVLSKHPEVVRALIRRGADVNAEYAGGCSYAVLDAVYSSNTEILEALLNGGARVSDVTTGAGYTALHVAAREGLLGPLRLLLNKKLSLHIDTIDLDGRTPLNSATKAGRVDAVRLLLEHGANSSISDWVGWPPLYWAVRTNCPPIVKLLLEYNAELMVQSSTGVNAAMIAIEYLEGKELKEMCDVFFRNNECMSLMGARNAALRQLLSAAESGNLDLITTIVEVEHFNVHSADDDGYTSILSASENGQDDAVRLLIRMGSDVEEKNAAGESCIWLASRYGHEAVVRILLENGADVNSADEIKQTAVSAAAEGGHLRVVETLLGRGANVRTGTIHGKTAYMFAVNGGHDAVSDALLVHDKERLPPTPIDLRETLLAQTREERFEGAKGTVGDEGAHPPDLGRDPEYSRLRPIDVSSANTTYTIRKPLKVVYRGFGDYADDNNLKDFFVMMAQHGMKATIERLIRSGRALDQKDQHGCLALGCAALEGHVSTVRVLLDHGFDPNLRANGGMTALYLASHGGRTKVVKVLIEAGASIDIPDNDLKSPLMAAVMEGRMKVLDLLLRAGANKDATDSRGYSALGNAVNCRNLEMVTRLLESGVDVDRGPNSEETPLSLAVRGGEGKMVHLLLQAGSTMRTWTANRSLLCVAAQLGLQDVIKTILEHGVEVDHIADQGWTALFYAAFSGHSMAARVLIEIGGANVRHRDENNLTALSIAKSRGHEGMAAMLRHASRLRSGLTTANSPQPNYFVYSPLSSPNFIRLLDLHAGLEHDTIAFDVYEMDLSRHPSYEALSYEWKDKTGSVPVQCNGRSHLITPNLKLALQNIRLQDKTRTLWVDAICINQTDNEERSSQVRMMPAIYRIARKVLMWLGKDSPAIEKAFETIPSVLSAWTQLSPSDIFKCGSHERAEICEKIIAVADGGKPYTVEAGCGVAALLGRSYFTRAWIYQEIVLAGDRGLVLCGRLRVPSNDLLRFMVMWATCCSTNYRAYYAIGLIGQTSAHVVGRGRTDMSFAMSALSLLNCGDPRDKVFAVLGVVDSSWSYKLAPDYSLSVQQVYINAATALIRTSMGVFFWNRLNYPAANQIPGLPSWVPDWTCISTRYLESDGGEALPSLFRQPVGRCVPVLFESQFCAKDTALYADIYLLGEIAFGVTMRAGEDIYSTIIRPVVKGLASLGLSIFDRCPCTETLSYLATFCRLLVDTSEEEEELLDVVQLYAEFLAWKIIADPSTPDPSRKVPPQLEAAVQEHSNLPIRRTDEICYEMERSFRKQLSALTDHTTEPPRNIALPSCDLYCTRSGHLGVAGEGTTERDFVVILLEGFESVAIMRKRKTGVKDDEWYEFVGGADILKLDWETYRTLEDVPIDGTMARIKIL